MEAYFESLWLRLPATGLYVIGLPIASMGLRFTYRELLQPGPKKTAVNQILAMNFGILSLHNIFLMGLDLVRLWYGPLPIPFCRGLFVLKGSVYLSISGFLMAITILKYLIVCVWKGFPENFDDDFISKTVLKGVISTSLALSLVSEVIPQRPSINQVNVKSYQGRENSVLP